MRQSVAVTQIQDDDLVARRVERDDRSYLFLVCECHAQRMAVAYVALHVARSSPTNIV